MSEITWNDTIILKNMALMCSSPTTLKCCERTLVTRILRMLFWAFKCQSWLWLHLNCVRCVISRLWIWIPYCSGVLSSEGKHAKNAVVSSYLHRHGPGLPCTQKQPLLSSRETRFLRIWNMCGCSVETAHQRANSLSLGQTTCCSAEVIRNRFGICDTRPSSKGQQVGELKHCTV